MGKTSGGTEKEDDDNERRRSFPLSLSPSPSPIKTVCGSIRAACQSSSPHLTFLEQPAVAVSFSSSKLRKKTSTGYGGERTLGKVKKDGREKEEEETETYFCFMGIWGRGAGGREMQGEDREVGWQQQQAPSVASVQSLFLPSVLCRGFSQASQDSLGRKN